MKPVDQTIIGEKGNCMSACLASLLHLDIAHVPNFFDISTNDDEWWEAVRSWLSGHGWGIISINLGDAFPPEKLNGYQIIFGRSKRKHNHATIWLNGEMVHDPHPDKTGLETIEGCDLLYPLDAGHMALSYCGTSRMPK